MKPSSFLRIMPTVGDGSFFTKLVGYPIPDDLFRTLIILTLHARRNASLSLSPVGLLPPDALILLMCVLSFSRPVHVLMLMSIVIHRYDDDNDNDQPQVLLI